MPKLRVATIGCGSIAQALHLPGYAKNRRCEIVAACDPDPARWAEVEKRFGVTRFYPDYREMLEHEALDAVSVASPNVFHYEQAMAAVRRGLHVLCEKPMVLTTRDAGKLAAAAEKSGKVFMVGFSHRYFRGNVEAKKLIDSGRIGRPFTIRVRFAHRGPIPGWAKSDWFYKKALSGGGAMLDMAIHAFDLCRFYMGDVKSVSAYAKTIVKPIEVDDNAIITMEFAQGGLGYIDVSWTSRPGFNGVEIYGAEGNIVVDYRNGMSLVTGVMSPDGKFNLKSKKMSFSPTEGGWQVEMDYFVDYIRGRKPCPVGPREGLAATEIAVAAYRSAGTGRRITL